MRRAAIGAFALVAGLACDSRAPSSPDASVPRLELGEACTDSAECTSGVCVGTSASAGVCSRECLSRRDCPEGESWACLQPAERSELRVCACTADGEAEVCGDGRDNDCNGRTDDCLACGDRLVVGDDDEHCGGCFNACAADEECQGGACGCAERTDTVCDESCVSTATDVNHCGACGNACPPGDHCVGGRCACPTDRPDRCTDGCVDFASDESHCGACGNACARDFQCVGGVCACPTDRPDRCSDECVDTETDGRHCGACGAACGAGLVCRGGSCECTATTVSDFCDGVGCVDLATDPANCGGCGDACPAGLVCRDGACACLIASTPDYCDAAGCVSLDTDLANCGTCGNACDAGLVCRAGACTCPDSTASLCGGECVSTQTNPLHCGGCGVTCRTGETCRFGSCQCSGLVCGDVCVPSGPSNCGGCGVTCGPEQYCSSGSCRCSLSTETGCSDGCHNLSTDPANCGACGNACPAGQLCSGSTCRCPTGQTWCPDLGRCVDLSNDRTSCGTCGNACPATQTCGSGTCRCSSTSQRYCASADACVDIAANDAHCGACDRACASGTVCSSYACRCPVSGQTYCASETSCVDTRTDSAHCGRCDNACPGGAACNASACVCTVAGQTPCSTGCTDLTTDESSCGACGTSCSAGQECRSGVCACPTPTRSAERRLTSSVASSNAVQLAAGTTHVGAVYLDGRAGRTNAYFRRLDASGAPAGTELALTSYATSGHHVSRADIVWTGAEWAVVWFQRVIVAGWATEQLVVQRIDESGALVGTPAVSSATGEVPYPDGPLVLMHSPTAGLALMYGVGSQLRLRMLGDGTAPAPAVEVTSYTSGGDAAVGAAGAFGVIYSATGGVYFQRVEPDGSVIATPVRLDTSGGAPAIAYDGAEHVFAWVLSSGIVGGESRLMVARGTGATTRVTAATNRVGFRSPRLSVRDGVALLTWQVENTIEARRFGVGVAGAPTALEPPWVAQPLPVLESISGQPHGAVWSGASSAILAWVDMRWTETEIYDLGLTMSACEEP